MTNNSITIAIDAFRLVCELNTSGHVYVRELALSLAESDQVAKILLVVPKAPDKSIRNYFNDHGKIEFRIEQQNYNPADSWFLHTKWIQLAVSTSLRKLASAGCPVDVYIAPYHQVPLLVSGDLLILSVIHDLCGLEADSGYKPLSRPYMRHWFNFYTAIRRANIIVPISEFTRGEMLRRYKASARRMADVAYNSVTARTLDRSRIPVGALELPDNYFLAYAAMGPRKGTDISIDAYKKYKKMGGKSSLVMIGGAMANQYWKAYAASVGVDDIVWCSGVSDLDRDIGYMKSKALLFPSRCEGFGYPIVEAMRQGTGVIALKNSPARELLEGLLPLMEDLAVDTVVDHMWRWDQFNGQQKEDLSAKLIESSSQYASNNLGQQFLRAIFAAKMTQSR
jgi:glycosyltransferase involved in cell wall biosynthesis